MSILCFLYILLAIAVVTEFRTFLIPNVLTIAGAAELLLARCTLGPQNWHYYFLAGILAFAACMLLQYVFIVLWDKGILLGMGAIKLLMMVAFGTGLSMTLVILPIFLLIVSIPIAVHYYFGIQFRPIPGSAIIAFATVVASFENGFQGVF